MFVLILSVSVQQLILQFVLSAGTCQTRDPSFVLNTVRHIFTLKHIKVLFTVSDVPQEAVAVFRRTLSWFWFWFQVCRQFFSESLECLLSRTPQYIRLCEQNFYSYERNTDISCAFFQEVVLMCGRSSHIWNSWRTLTKCGGWKCSQEFNPSSFY